jgi:hypothetical protein
MSNNDLLLDLLLGKVPQEETSPDQMEPVNLEQLCPTAQRVRSGLPNLLNSVIGYVPQAGMVNGIILGLCDVHLKDVPEEELVRGLTEVINLISYWRDGANTETTEEARPVSS